MRTAALALSRRSPCWCLMLLCIGSPCMAKEQNHSPFTCVGGAREESGRHVGHVRSCCKDRTPKVCVRSGCGVPGRVHTEADEHLAGLTARERVTLLDEVERQLLDQPTVETRNRKPMRPNPPRRGSFASAACACIMRLVAACFR